MGKTDYSKYPARYFANELVIKEEDVVKYGRGFFVFTKSGTKMYPYLSGRSKEECERWIKASCATKNDKVFKKDFLLRLINTGETNGVVMVENNRVYEGERHDSYKAVFRDTDGRLYGFDYYVDFYGTAISKWNSDENQVSKEKYLCRRMKPKTIKKVIYVEFRKK